MSEIKRIEQGYGTQNMLNLVALQPLLFKSVVTSNGEQYLEIDAAHLDRLQNSQPSFLYFIAPKDENNTMQTPYFTSSIQKTNDLHMNGTSFVNHNISLGTNQSIKAEIEDDITQNHKVDSNKHVVNKREMLDDYDQDNDPLEIREHISYAVAKRYNEAIKEAPTENVIKHNEFIWKTQIKCDYYPTCKVVLTSHYEKKLHMDDHKFPVNTSFKCSICNMLFSKATERNKHIDSHSVPHTYKCDDCLKTFPYYTTYVKHLHDHKCAPVKDFTCVYCGSFFACAQYVRTHQELDTRTCVCDQKMCHKDALNMHRKACLEYKKTLNHIFKKNRFGSTDVIILE